LPAHISITTMNYTHIEPFYVIGIAVRTTNENGQSAQDIGALWAQFTSRNLMENIPGRIDNTIYSVYTDYESDHTKPYTTLLGCRVHNLDIVPEGMTGKSFEGGRYVNLPAKGDISRGIVFEKWTEIWAMDLPRTFTADFEVYGAKATNPANAQIDILVAVK
jgi:predicted transcriptional regulator YdeE